MKRFLFLFAVMIGFWSVADAQTIVSTEPSNRNVVLEEYTGIYCGYCPDGHRIASELRKANPEDVFLINIHTTSNFSTPQGDHPDFRTADGDELSQPAGITGFPAGSVNRSTTPWAQGRGTWNNVVPGILAKASPVNIGVKANVDLETKELVVNVEYYYTADEANPTNKLTVVLTQNEIVGYQSGASANPDYITANGLYRHQHALRDVLTESVWGDVITQTTKGTFGEKEYRVALPESIKGIDVDITNLEVVAFIAQDKAEIITGAGTRVDIPAENKIMLSMEDQTTLPDGMFFDAINPKVEVTNNFDTEVTQFDLLLDINGQQEIKTVTETLAKGQSTVVDFGQIDATFTGVYAVTVVGFGNINNSNTTGDILVEWTNDDNMVQTRGIRLARKAFTDYVFDFENAFENGYLDMSQNAGMRISGTANQPVGANNTNAAVMFYLHESWQLDGKPGSIVLGEAALSQMSAPAISYHYAYSDGTLGGNPPTIKLEVSENDGQSWTEVSSFEATETAVGNNQTLYVPASSDYIKKVHSLADYAGKDILVKLSLIPRKNGNAAWIDQIEFSDAGGTIYVSDDAIDFGEVAEGDSKEQTITIENKSDASLNITSITIKDDISNAYYLVDTPTSLTLDANASQTITVEFSPLKKDETYNAKLVINSNDPSNPAVEVALTGKGTGTSVEEEFISNTSLKLMPNPVVTTATLNYNYNGNDAVNVSYTLSDLNGKTVANLGNATITSGTNTLEFDVADLAAGKYFLVITAENGSVQQISVVVEK